MPAFSLLMGLKKAKYIIVDAMIAKIFCLPIHVNVLPIDLAVELFLS
ncbi:hypothetical protein [Arsenophonus endosymbiont of Aleurodicus dispersus]|nr:hypothetical protein [Arsenophonus endosymbiont of Aleurodicus dispersus]